MPFESDRQRRFMYAKHPKIARRWTREAKKKGEPVTKSLTEIAKGRIVYGPDTSKAISSALRSNAKKAKEEAKQAYDPRKEIKRALRANAKKG